MLAPASPAIDSILDRAPLDRTHWGVHVVDLATGGTLYERQPDHHFIPASVMKLVTVAAALDRLGPEYRYRTHVRGRGRADLQLDGLLLIGSGDPTWSARFHPDDFAVLDSLADSLYRAGIRT